jgi:hypothetical protein
MGISRPRCRCAVGRTSGILHEKGRSVAKRAFAGRFRVRLLVSVAAVLCSALAIAIAMLAGAGSAGAAQPHGPQDKTITATYQGSPVSPVSSNARPALTVACGPGLNEYNRTQLCWEGILTFTFKTDGEPVGTLKAKLVQYIDLDPRSGNWTQDDTVISAVPEGTTAPVEVDLTAVCGSPCEATALFSGVVAGGLVGPVVYTDAIANGDVNTTPTLYTLDYDAPPYIPESELAWASPISYRCDQGVAAKGTGCVFPEFTPTLDLSIKQAGASAALFRWAQEHMDMHWGLKGEGSPLTRVSGEDGDDNRKVVCDGTFRRQGPVVVNGGKNDVDSCDEFPLAATKQSGAATLQEEGKKGTACAQLQSVRTSRRGSEAAQWGNVKVIGKPNYAAPCVRGHVPSRLNDSTGGSYITFASNQRLFVGDNFWVSVGP